VERWSIVIDAVLPDHDAKRAQSLAEDLARVAIDHGAVAVTSKIDRDDDHDPALAAALCNAHVYEPDDTGHCAAILAPGVLCGRNAAGHHPIGN
jgi:hypothetical protein